MPSAEAPIAYPARYTGPGVHQKAFSGSGFGVVFEDDERTGYFYATTEDFKILDALHLYNRGAPSSPRIGDTVYFVWHPTLVKAGIFYRDTLHAIVDFKNRVACCRSGFPPKTGSWCTSSHEWDDSLVDGLAP